jgi:lipoyl(octanoyl) transferase
MTRPLLVVCAGTVPYRDALRWQHALATARIEGRLATDTLLLLEHPPVLTLGRATGPGHVRRATGIEVVEVERGGDVTFHGPGQLVGYPIVDLSEHRRDVHWYLRALEQVLIDALGCWGLPATRRAGYTGVWTRGRKIASLGVHVKHWVTWHGFALNVTTALEEFERIVPCGLAGVEMTSVTTASRERLGARMVEAVTHAFEHVFDCVASPATATPPLVHSDAIGATEAPEAPGRVAPRPPREGRPARQLARPPKSS